MELQITCGPIGSEHRTQILDQRCTDGVVRQPRRLLLASRQTSLGDLVATGKHKHELGGSPPHDKPAARENTWATLVFRLRSFIEHGVGKPAWPGPERKPGGLDWTSGPPTPPATDHAWLFVMDVGMWPCGSPAPARRKAHPARRPHRRTPSSAPRRATPGPPPAQEAAGPCNYLRWAAISWASASEKGGKARKRKAHEAKASLGGARGRPVRLQ